jgi:hypothetical protein
MIRRRTQAPEGDMSAASDSSSMSNTSSMMSSSSMSSVDDDPLRGLDF